MKILVISSTAWNTNNSFGNTYSNFFSAMEDVEIANIFLSDGAPSFEKNVTSYYQVSEKAMIKSITNLSRATTNVGKYYIPDWTSKEELRYPNTNWMRMARTKRWTIFFILRECIWKFGKMDINQIMEYVGNFNPDIIFLPLYYSLYVSRLALKIQEYFNLPMVSEASIDIYTMKQISWDPLFWLDRIVKRKMIRKVIKHSSFLYVISEKQKKDYEKIFNLPCKILTKMPDTQYTLAEYKQNNGILKFLYTGNIGDHRWESLAVIAKAIKAAGNARLDIYTATVTTNKMRKKLSIPNISYLHEPVNGVKVRQLQEEADVLIHVESLRLKERLRVKYSISTKIMDYLMAGRCIFAVCTPDLASYEYLEQNRTALIAENRKKIFEGINELVTNRNLIVSYAKQCHTFGRCEINGAEMRKNLYKDMINVLESVN